MEDLHFLRLWDMYSPLLTDRQREISDLYFNCDLSLGEIAEEKGVSRQSVSECLQTCRAQLEEYENKLHLCRHLEESEQKTVLIKKDVLLWAEEMKKSHSELSGEISRLEEIVKTE